MAFESNFVTFIGNLTQDPDLKFTQGGNAVASLRVASNRKYKGKDGAEQEDTTFLNVNVWRDQAENVAESLTKGDRVVVVGRVKVRSYDNKEGHTVWVTEIEADEVAPSLRFTKTGSSSGSISSTSSAKTAPSVAEEVPF